MIIHVSVHPNSNESRIEKVGENKYVVHLVEKAEDNKANKELIKILSNYFGVSWKKIVIKNPKSREKIVEIND